MAVIFRELMDAFEFVNLNQGMNEAYVDKQSGKIYWHNEDEADLEGGLYDELPDDIEDEEKYVPVPDKRSLDLGKPLVLDFASQYLADDFDQIRRIFSRRGAYGHFKDLLARRRALDRWYEFEAKAQERALRVWCEVNSIEIAEDTDASSRVSPRNQNE